MNPYETIPATPEAQKAFHDVVIAEAIDRAKERHFDNDIPDKNDASHESKTAPSPLPSMPAVMPFDFDYLPKGARGYVKDIAQRMQCPADYLGVTVYIMLAAVIGRKVGIRPLKYDDWTVIPNLWGASIGNSGTLKSPAQAAVLAPIKKLAADAYDRYKTECTEYETKALLCQLKQSANKSAAKKQLQENCEADVSGLLKPDVERSRYRGETPLSNQF